MGANLIYFFLAFFWNPESLYKTTFEIRFQEMLYPTNFEGLSETFWRPGSQLFWIIPKFRTFEHLLKTRVSSLKLVIINSGLLNTFWRLRSQLFKSLLNSGLLNTFWRPGSQLFQSLVNSGLLNTFWRPGSQLF